MVRCLYQYLFKKKKNSGFATASHLLMICPCFEVRFTHFDCLRLLSHYVVCNRGRTQSGAIKISWLNNPVGSSTHAVYGKSVIRAQCAVQRVDCQPWPATILWGSLLYLLKDILTLYGILPCVRTAVTHPSLANFMCLGMVRRQSCDICVKKRSPVLYCERSRRETV